MKKIVKKVLIMLMLLLIFFSSINFCNFNRVEATTNGHSADDAINWVNSLITTSQTPVGSGHCVDLIVAYYNYLGHNSPHVDHAKDYTTKANEQPVGWQTLEGAQPQKGDILIYLASAGNPSGHVAIYESDTVTYHQNYGGTYVRKIPNHYTAMYDKPGNLMPYWGVIRPDFKQEVVPVNLGENFNGAIMKSYGAMVSAPGGAASSVKIESTTGEEHQYWNFERQSDGSYRIRNIETNWYLEVQGSNTIDGTDAVVNGYNDVSAQYWYICGTEDNYHLIPKNETNLSLATKDGSSDSGTNVYLKNNSASDSAQKFIITKANLDVPLNIGTDFDAVIHKAYGKVIATPNGSNSEVKSEIANGENYQKWTFIKQNDGSYRIKNKETGYYLEAQGFDVKSGMKIVVNGYNNLDAQLWYITGSENWYQIVPKYARYLSLFVANNADPIGTNALLWKTYPTDSCFRFVIYKETKVPVNLGDEFEAKIKNIKSQKYLQTNNITSKDMVCIQNESTDEIQLWEFIRQIDGSYRIKNKKTGYYLEAQNRGIDFGTKVIVNGKNEEPAQYWYIFKINNNYQIVPKYAQYMSIRTNNNGTSAGTNIVLNENKEDEFETFEIIKSSSNSYQLGDINRDGKVNVTDVAKVNAHARGISELTADELNYADVNGDGKINVTDVSKINLIAKGIEL